MSLSLNLVSLRASQWPWPLCSPCVGQVGDTQDTPGEAWDGTSVILRSSRGSAIEENMGPASGA